MTDNDNLKRLLKIISDESTLLIGFNVEVKEPFEIYRPVDSRMIKATTFDNFEVNISLNMSRESAERIVRIGQDDDHD